MASQLGHPAFQHFIPPAPHARQNHHHGVHAGEVPQPRRKGPGQHRRDRARAAAHHARLSQQQTAPLSAATAATQLSDSDPPPPAATAGQPPHPPPPTPSQPDAPAGGLSPPANQLSPPAAASVVVPCPSNLRSAVSAEDEPNLSTAISAAASNEPVVTPITDEVCDDEHYGDASGKQAAQEQVRPEFVPVHCVATFENCPDSQLNQDYVDSLMRYMNSEPHLQQNIERADLKHLSSRSFRNGVFIHTVDVTMHVRTARLWESPASYVRKFLGLTNMWERSNGTVIKLSRIHQK